MLLELILRRMHTYCEFANSICAMFDSTYFKLMAMVELLVDMMPKCSKKPIKHDIEYDHDNSQVIFVFSYDTDNRHETRMTFDELYQYFCTVLGEKEC